MPVRGAAEILSALARLYRVVAIVSGRPSDELERLLPVEGLTLFGLYGMEEVAPDIADVVAPPVERVASAVPGSRVEHKASSVAVHYRQASEPDRARALLLPALEEVAAAHGMRLIEGKMVLELVPSGRPMKGGAVTRILGEHGLRAALFAGDDLADLEAFDALDEARTRGVTTVKVAVAGADAPVALIERADLVVQGPPELMELLGQLA